MRELLLPFYPDIADSLLDKLHTYLGLLLRWNARTNLTAVRTPEDIVTRHFGESLFAARYVPRQATTLLDVGAGAGFPGLPIQLAMPPLAVTLAESQGKKVAFLREAARVLQVEIELWPDRMERMPTERRFDCLTMRAVDRSATVLEAARAHLKDNGTLLHLTSGAGGKGMTVPIPGSTERVLLIESRVPRGTPDPMFHVEHPTSRDY